MDKELEKVKTLLIKLDLEYQAKQDKLNAQGYAALMDFPNDYKKFNTINVLDVLNKLKDKLNSQEIDLSDADCLIHELDKELKIAEKALELACKSMSGKCSYCIYANEPQCPPNHHCSNLVMQYFKEEAKEIVKLGKEN